VFEWRASCSCGEKAKSFVSSGGREFETDLLVQELGIARGSHVALLILDGLGMNLLQTLPKKSFLRKNLRRTINAVFPSSTATAITSITTATCPAEHGVLGWTLTARSPLVSIDDFEHETQRESEEQQHHQYNQANFPLRFNPLPFVPERRQKEHVKLSGETLDKLGVPAHQVFRTPCAWPELDVHTAAMHEYLTSEYSVHHMNAREKKHCNGGIESVLSALHEFWRARVASQNETDLASTSGQEQEQQRATQAESFAYVYCAEPDSTCHSYGFESKLARRALAQIDEALSAFWTRVEQDTALANSNLTLIITADHGHRTVSKNQVTRLQNSSVIDCLSALPSTEPRNPCMFVKQSRAQELEESWRNDPSLSQHFCLLSIADAERLHLFGKQRLSQHARRFAGDFIALSASGRIILDRDQPLSMIGWHGGLTRAEMIVPLVVAAKNKTGNKHHAQS